MKTAYREQTATYLVCVCVFILLVY